MCIVCPERASFFEKLQSCVEFPHSGQKKKIVLGGNELCADSFLEAMKRAETAWYLAPSLVSLSRLFKSCTRANKKASEGTPQQKTGLQSTTGGSCFPYALFQLSGVCNCLQVFRVVPRVG